MKPPKAHLDLPTLPLIGVPASNKNSHVREERKKMAVLENDWDDSVPSCLGGKKGERTGKKDLCVEKND